VATDLPLHNGHPLGRVAPPKGFRSPFKRSLPRKLDPATWVEFELQDCPAKVLDQNGYGACNGFAAVTSLEIARWVAGLPHVDLSPWYVYAILCNGIDRGSIISDALKLLQDKGAPPNDYVPYGTIQPRKLSQKAHDNAGRFQTEVSATLDTFQEMMIATQLRRPFNFSIRVGAGFDDLDADGCPRLSPGVGNHAVAGGLGAKRARNGEWLIKAQNSWATRWGLNGYFWFRESHIRRQTYREAYCVAAVETDPENDTLPSVR
jgi:hypothetical protein